MWELKRSLDGASRYSDEFCALIDDHIKTSKPRLYEDYFQPIDDANGPLQRIALESFLIARRQMIRPGYFLLTTQNGLPCRFVRFRLGAHFLDLRCLLLHGCDETCHRRFQLLSPFVLFEKLVEQHRVYGIVSNGVDFAVLVAHHEVGIHSRYFFGDQTKLRCIHIVALVLERYWLKAQDRFAGAVYRFNLFF